MQKRKIAAIIILFMLVLTGIRLVWIQNQNSPSDVKADNGQLDLRSWDSSSDSVLSLNGEWEFFPYKLIMQSPKNGDAWDGDAKIVSLPSDWKRDLSSERDSTFGYGSYRLRILIEPNSTQSYSIRIPGISSSSAVFVNGQLLAQSGQPAENAEEYTASNVPYSASFTTDRSVIDIVVHVANYDDRVMGGMMQPIKFGTEAAVTRATWFSIGNQLGVCLLLLMHAVYTIILYVIGARHKSLLYFSLMFVCGTVTIIIDDDRILPAWFPVNYEWTYKLYYLSFLGIAAFNLQYFKGLLPPFSILRKSRWYLAVCGLYALFVLILPIKILSYSDLFHTLLTVIPFVIVPVLSVLAVRRGSHDVIYLLLGTTAIIMNVIWGIIKNSGTITGGYYPFDMLAAFIAFALYWFKRYFRASAESARLAEKLQAADKLKDEFLVNTSHELRNPLHGILNIAQTVIDSDGPYDQDRNETRMKLLVSVGKRMSHLLDDLLDLARFKDNRIRLHPVNLRIQTVVSGVLDMIRFMTEGKPIRLIVNIPSSFPPIRADENRLIQILFNLLHNAAKFTDEGQIKIDAYVKDGKAIIQISDTGIGMDEETQSRIFEPYEQGDVYSSASGLGLGLTITKRLVELHDGTLTVRSIPDQGSVFAFSMPISALGESLADGAAAEPVVPLFLPETTAADEAAAATIAIADHVTVDRPSILAIDDDPVNLSVLASVLSPNNYDIVTATSGAEALSLLDSRMWDLLIVDVMMPRMSGYEVAQAVRARFSHSELPILLLTARSRAEDIEAGFKSGANDYVTKPVDALELRSRVGALTQVTRAVREQTRMESAWLQAQIQPHFLFNTLNSLAALSEIDIVRMRNLLRVFGDYLRASFDFDNSDRIVPLHRELELVRAYLFIEQERFEDRIQVVWDIEEGLQLNIPPLSIQPLVENAVRHGLLKRARGGKIQIRVGEFDEYAEISVQDDGVGMDGDTLNQVLRKQPEAGRGSGIGLANTDRRLRQLYGQGLRVVSSPGQGTLVSFVVRR
ncbi:hybrid sensor histidine kinase/response regulator [Cohnella cholangitidis]|uniref:histidine kinase n=1 Tax=Cohnella cholangitidis TaxID=2598458 RepID=A0A7G5BYH5_9BACL|nr:ATP-binding protein [Cohnella cholangitidis]QMV42009.1 response regulator [Cohnella cholangitidis]